MSNLNVVSNNIGTSATLSASTEAGLLVVDNLKSTSKTLIWRSTGTTETVTATYTQQNVGCVSLAVCNFTSTATMRIRIYTNSGDGSPAYDSGVLLCCEYTTIDKINFAGGPLNANTFNYGGGTYATLFAPNTLSEKTVIDVVDTSNTNGYLEASSIVLGETWTPILNCNYGAALTFKDTTKNTRSDSGDMRTTKGGRYKSLTFALGLMSSVDRIALTEMFIRNGSSDNVYISIFPDSPDIQEKQVYQVYGIITKQAGVKRHKYSRDQSSMTIEEM